MSKSGNVRNSKTLSSDTGKRHFQTALLLCRVRKQGTRTLNAVSSFQSRLYYSNNVFIVGILVAYSYHVV